MNVENTAKIVGINHQTFRQKMASYKRHPGSLVVLLLTILAAVITAGVLLSLIVYIVVMGVPNIRLSMFAWKYTTENCSMLPSILNTLMMTVLTLVIAVPIGAFSAIYLVEYAKKGNKFVGVVRVTAETLSGIPSIVYGLFGMIFFVGVLKMQLSLLSGSLTVAIMVLPTIMRTTEEALLSVPQSYREGSFGLGAGKLRTVFRIVLPSAVPGILSGVILATGRIVGETAALIYTAGTMAKVPNNLFASARTLSVHMYLLSNEGLHTNEAFATAVVLLVFVMLINMLANFVARRLSAKNAEND